MPDQVFRILIVEDDPDLRLLLADNLRREGFEVAAVEDGHGMDAWLLRHGAADLIIFDSMLSEADGRTLVRRLREASQVPIIMLSARGGDLDRIRGLEVGADDYLAKPFHLRELLARIRAVLRRRGQPCPPVVDGAMFGPYFLDRNRRELTKDGKPIPLTGTELDLLQILVAHPNRILHRDELLELLKGYERSPFDRSIDVQVARLRAKIEPDTKRPRYIRTVWGKGYLFTPRGEPSA